MARPSSTDREALIERAFAAEALRLSLIGGCPVCDLEPDDMCAACGLCNCDRHDTCTRPTPTTMENTK